MADGDENAVDRLLGDFVGLDVVQHRGLDLQRVLVADHVFEHGIPKHRDFRVLIKPLLQDALGAQMIAAMNQRDLGGEIGQEQRLLDRGIAAADHQHFLVAIEKAVAGGAGGDAIAAEFLLARQIEPARLGAGRENHAHRRDRCRRNRIRGGTAAASDRRLLTWSATSLVPTWAACFCICSMSQGPWITSAKPG